jgi:hypothetical protein
MNRDTLRATALASTARQNDGAAEAMGKFAQDRGIKRVYLMAPNYQVGKEMLAGFKRFYKGDIAAGRPALRAGDGACRLARRFAEPACSAGDRPAISWSVTR